MEYYYQWITYDMVLIKALLISVLFFRSIDANRLLLVLAKDAFWQLFRMAINTIWCTFISCDINLNVNKHVYLKYVDNITFFLEHDYVSVWLFLWILKHVSEKLKYCVWLKIWNCYILHYACSTKETLLEDISSLPIKS